MPSLPCILFGTSIPHVEFTVSLQCTCLKKKYREICPYANINAHKHYIIISTIVDVYNGFYLHKNMIRLQSETPSISFLFKATCHRAAASRPLPSATSDPFDKMPGTGGNCLKDPRVGSRIHGHLVGRVVRRAGVKPWSPVKKTNHVPSIQGVVNLPPRPKKSCLNQSYQGSFYRFPNQ